MRIPKVLTLTLAFIAIMLACKSNKPTLALYEHIVPGIHYIDLSLTDGKGCYPFNEKSWKPYCGWRANGSYNDFYMFGLDGTFYIDATCSVCDDITERDIKIGTWYVEQSNGYNTLTLKYNTGEVITKVYTVDLSHNADRPSYLTFYCGNDLQRCGNHFREPRLIEREGQLTPNPRYPQ